MSAPLAILCYHRILDDAARAREGWPYFARGTAVSRSNFALQLRQICERLTILDEDAVIAWAVEGRDLDRPSVWLTFDDGYTDVIEHALPSLSVVNARASVFVTTCTLATPRRALTADRWYAALARARQRGVLALGRERWAFDLDRPADRARLVDGPERRRCLYASEVEREEILAALSDALASSTEPPVRLYLSPADLRDLVSHGWSIGAHGATHIPFPALAADALTNELDEVDRAFEHNGLPHPEALAYPDGACSDRAEASVGARGYRLGMVLGDQLARRTPLRLCRFIVPDEPRWVEDVLIPTLGALG